MKFQDIILGILGLAILVLGIVALNDFVGGSPLLMYFGTPVALGFVIMGIGGAVWLLVADYVV